jgi:hypothetical protein
LESKHRNVTSFHDKVNIGEFTSHGMEGPFSTITLSMWPFHVKMVTFPNAECKGESIGPKGVVQAPSTQNSAYESSSHNKRKADKTD